MSTLFWLSLNFLFPPIYLKFSLLFWPLHHHRQIILILSSGILSLFCRSLNRCVYRWCCVIIGKVTGNKAVVMFVNDIIISGKKINLHKNRYLFSFAISVLASKGPLTMPCTEKKRTLLNISITFLTHFQYFIWLERWS